MANRRYALTPFLVLCTVTALAACGGGSGPSGAPGIAAQSAGSTNGTVTLTVSTSKAASAIKRQTQFVSPSASSVGISANGGMATYSDISASSTLCTTVSGGRTCTVPLSAPVGSVAFTVTIYDGAAGSGNVLGSGTSTTTTAIGSAFAVTVTVNPFVATANAPVFTFASGTAFTAGTAGSATVAFTLLDPDGNVINASNTNAFASPLLLSSSDAHVTVSPSSWTGPSQTVTLTYDGSTAIGTTVTATIKVASATIGTASTATTFHYVVSTFAGSGNAGATNGANASASFNGPLGLTVDTSNNVFVAEHYSNDIRKISGGSVTTFSGTGVAGALNGPALTATYNYPIALAFDSAGNLYVADFNNDVIRRVSTAGTVTTFAGSGAFGSTNGPGTSATFNVPQGTVFDASGNLYIPDINNNEIRVISPAGVVGTFAGTGVQGATDGPAATATFNQPSGIAIDPSGNIFVSDTYNNKIRKITPAGVVSTISGTGAAGATNGAGNTATFNHPQGIVVDSAGDLLVSDQFNQLIRKVTPTGVTSTIAGTGATGATDGPGASATFNQPTGISVDSNGIIYVADFNNNKIRAITP